MSCFTGLRHNLDTVFKQYLNSIIRVKILLAVMLGLYDALLFGGCSRDRSPGIAICTSFLGNGTPKFSAKYYISQFSMPLSVPWDINGSCVCTLQVLPLMRSGLLSPFPLLAGWHETGPGQPSGLQDGSHVWRVLEQQGERSTAEPSHQPQRASWNC